MTEQLTYSFSAQVKHWTAEQFEEHEFSFHILHFSLSILNYVRMLRKSSKQKITEITAHNS